MNKKIIIILIIITLILLSTLTYFSLNKQKQTTYNPLLNQTEFTDEEIVHFVNSDIVVPNNFFLDEDQKFLGKYGGVLYADYELDDKNIFYCAKNISDTDYYVNEFTKNESGGGLKGVEYDVSVIESSENYRFYEFKINKKEKRGSRKYNYQYRIFKCSYINDLLHGVYGNPNLNKDNVDNMYIGTIKLRPITMETVKEFSESMWNTGGFDYGEKVINSFTKKQNNLFNHSIYETKTACLKLNDYCSTELYKANFIIDKNSGKINFSRNKIK